MPRRFAWNQTHRQIAAPFCWQVYLRFKLYCGKTARKDESLLRADYFGRWRTQAVAFTNSSSSRTMRYPEGTSSPCWPGSCWVSLLRRCTQATIYVRTRPQWQTFRHREERSGLPAGRSGDCRAVLP